MTALAECADCAQPLASTPPDVCGCAPLHLCSHCGRSFADSSPLCDASARHEERDVVPLLDWRDSAHGSSQFAPCRLCRRMTSLRDGAGRPAHKMCVEAVAFAAGGPR